MRSTRLVCFILLSFTLSFAACVSAPENQQQSGGAAGGAARTGSVRIGFAMDTLKEERWQRDKSLVEQRAKELGMELLVDVADGDEAKQLNQVDNMLTRGIDVLLIAPTNGKAARTLVERAHEKGVPVVSYDRLILDSDVDLYVSHQVERMGEMQARYALERAPKGNYVLIGGAPTDNNALLMRKGQMNVLQPAIDRGDIKIVSDPFVRDWLASEARRFTDDALTKTGNDIQAIVASNDGTAGGAIAALPVSLIGKVIVTGQDAQLDAVQAIAEGRQTMTIYKQIQPLAYGAVDNAVKLARKEPINAPDRINNGKIEVPSILLEPVVVDKNNLRDTVIKDGYHKAEDVFRGATTN